MNAPVPPFIVHVEDEGHRWAEFALLLKRVAEAKGISVSDVTEHLVQFDNFADTRKFFEKHPTEIAAVFTDNALKDGEWADRIMSITSQLNPKPVRVWVATSSPFNFKDADFAIPTKPGIGIAAHLQEIDIPIMQQVIKDTDAAGAKLLREKCPAFGIKGKFFSYDKKALLAIKTASQAIDALGLSQSIDPSAKTALAMAGLETQTESRRPADAAPKKTDGLNP